MEPLDDQELNSALGEWRAPNAPSILKRRVLPQPVSPWKWLVQGRISVPVPVGILALALVALWILFGQQPAAPVVQDSPGSTLADFQPVEQLRPTLVETGDANEQKYK